MKFEIDVIQPKINPAYRNTSQDGLSMVILNLFSSDLAPYFTYFSLKINDCTIPFENDEFSEIVYDIWEMAEEIISKPKGKGRIEFRYQDMECDWIYQDNLTFLIVYRDTHNYIDLAQQNCYSFSNLVMKLTPKGVNL